MSQAEALSLQAYSWGLTTDFLNPCQYKLRMHEDKGSLFESTRSIELLDREKLDTPWLSYGKPIRAVARMLFSIGVSVLVAPSGLAYHALSAITRSVMMLQGQDQARHNWQKVREHTWAFSRDLLVGTMGILQVAYIAIGIPLSPFNVLPAVTTCLVPISNGIWPRFMTEFWRMPEQKAHIYRDEFGIAGQKGRLLSVDPAVDQEDLQLNGQLGRLWRAKHEALVATVEAINNDPLQQNKITYIDPPNGHSIARSLQHDVQLSTGQYAKARLQELQNDIDLIKQLFTECIDSRYKDRKQNRNLFSAIPISPIIL